MKRSLCFLLVLLQIGLLGAAVLGQSITNPDTFVKVAIHTIESLDPQFHTGSTSAEITGNICDTLFDHVEGDINTVAPALATVVPTIENGLITEAADGTTFIVCPIREGVKFHNGAVLTPEDVEYTFERAALVGGIYTTLSMIYKPLLGMGVFSDLVDDVGYDEAFDMLDRAIEVQGNSIVFRLIEPFGPFLNLITGDISGMVIFNKAWCVEQGCWPGTKETGQEHMNLVLEDDPLFDKAMGTGPFKLLSWEQGERIVLERFDDYWKGPAKLARVIREVVPDNMTGLLMVKAGDADLIEVDVADLGLAEGSPGVTVLTDLATPWLMKMNFNFDIAEGSQYIGDGQLGETGIPTDFFTDLDLRKAFQYSFDWDAYINDVFLGHAKTPYGPVLVGMPTANPDNPRYYYDADKATEHFKKAWAGAVWENGFKMTLLYSAGSTHRQRAIEVLKARVEALNPKFHIELASLPWASFLGTMKNHEMPISLFGLVPSAFDPWVVLYRHMHSEASFAIDHGYTELAKEKYDALIDELATAMDVGRRTELSYELQRLSYEDSLSIFHFQAVLHLALRDWVQGFYVGVHPFNTDFWPLYKAYE